MLKARPGPQMLGTPSHAYAIPATEVTEAVLFRFTDYVGDLARSKDCRHIFCGMQQGHVAICPNCDRPMTLLLTLDTADPRLQLAGCNRDLTLLFCWRCALWQTSRFGIRGNPAYAEEHARERAAEEAQWYTKSGPLQIVHVHLEDGEHYMDMVPFYYHIHADNSVTLLQYRQGPAEPDWPYPDYPEAFPEAKASLLRLTEEIEDAIRARSLGEEAEYLSNEEAWLDFPDLDYLFGHDEWHQVGGEPYNCYGWFTMQCPLCGGDMPFLAHIVDKCEDPRGFVGGRDWDVLFHACAKCFVLGAFSRT